ncbi:PhzF family phenazine biosynthesis protein [Salinimonas chungwhensis]|uniref:PhzF family phenazine biosynthesis protein n=1 Tax=Salinimonas chungwhensis TaxID=265425 RepID=UPI000378A559|nr:PhzF family phenazine biosynthesis protein [Salinimonas chungwhensis]
MNWHVDTYYAFTRHGAGGNPAGVCLSQRFPEDTQMLDIAAQMGFSETAFAIRHGTGFRVRYFSPAAEVDFCGHATLALGKALAVKFGDGSFTLQLNHSHITVSCSGSTAYLHSPPASARPISQPMLEKYLAICGISPDALSKSLPGGLAYAGNLHLMLPLPAIEDVDTIAYDFEKAKRAMQQDQLTTLVPMHVAQSSVHMRNLFAAGNVYEDPATGAAAAAVAGYLRDHQCLTYSTDGTATLSFTQGDAMGQPCTLAASLTDKPDTSVTVSGDVIGPIDDTVII